MSYAFWFRQDHEKNVHQAPWVPRSSWQQGEFPLYSNQEAPHDLEMIHHPDETDRRSGKQQHFRKRWKFDFYRTIGKVKGQKSHATNHGALAPVPTAGAASRGRPKDAQSPNHWHLASFFRGFPSSGISMHFQNTQNGWVFLSDSMTTYHFLAWSYHIIPVNHHQSILTLRLHTFPKLSPGWSCSDQVWAGLQPTEQWQARRCPEPPKRGPSRTTCPADCWFDERLCAETKHLLESLLSQLYKVHHIEIAAHLFYIMGVHGQIHNTQRS